MTGPEPFAPLTPLIAAHVACGVVAVVAGAGAMLAVKGSTRHRRFGLIYLGALLGLALSTSVLAGEAWGERWHLFVLGVVALAMASLGFLVSPRRRPARIRPSFSMGGNPNVVFHAHGSKEIDSNADLKERVRAFWQAHPCGTKFSDAEMGTPEFFERVEAHRYTKEWHIPEVPCGARGLTGFGNRLRPGN